MSNNNAGMKKRTIKTKYPVFLSLIFQTMRQTRTEQESMLRKLLPTLATKRYGYALSANDLTVAPLRLQAYRDTARSHGCSISVQTTASVSYSISFVSQQLCGCVVCLWWLCFLRVFVLVSWFMKVIKPFLRYNCSFFSMYLIVLQNFLASFAFFTNV